MPSDFRRDLYAGTAGDYDRYRVGYAPALIDDLRVRAALTGAGRLLDLACGTGQITFAMRSMFAEVWAVDQERETVAFAEAKDTSGSVRWICEQVERLDAPTGHFELIAIGNAFHRLPRHLVAGRAFRWLRPGGFIALLWYTPPWRGASDWQVTMASIIDAWMTSAGTTDRIPSGWEDDMAEHPNLEILGDAGFDIVGSFAFPTPHRWTVETLTGFAFSTSTMSRRALGDHAAVFATDLQERLLECEPDGTFDADIDFGYDLLRRPGEPALIH
jgi:SAM-dependent methyltransferase